jgi:hypothetical protein
MNEKSTAQSAGVTALPISDVAVDLHASRTEHSTTVRAFLIIAVSLGRYDRRCEAHAAE